MRVDRVTITGADDSVTADELIEITKRFPFVEWGILYSRSSQGTPRYPSGVWCLDHLERLAQAGARLSAHLCGYWVRRLVLDGAFEWRERFAATQHFYPRIQLNFHGEFHKQHPTFSSVLKQDGRQFILQCDGVNDRAVLAAHVHSGVGVPLFDRSHGGGVVPETWPVAWPGVYCGYAGGLGPSNVVDQLTRIGEVSGDERIWIDMERQVRSADDTRLDLTKVLRVLEHVAPFITAEPALAQSHGDQK